MNTIKDLKRTIKQVEINVMSLLWLVEITLIISLFN